MEPDAEACRQYARHCHMTGCFSPFASMIIIALSNSINKEIPMKSLARSQHHHVLAFGPPNTYPNQNVPSSNTPSEPCWPGIPDASYTEFRGLSTQSQLSSPVKTVPSFCSEDSSRNLISSFEILIRSYLQASFRNCRIHLKLTLRNASSSVKIQ
jgi:hypothetical protein